ncbi:MAG: leucine-rich repeat domain-containing protein [Bacteroidetes bacterium]|nr:leucine-rich repeat domain-containing protein [Bacteroidota bacterium]
MNRFIAKSENNSIALITIMYANKFLFIFCFLLSTFATQAQVLDSIGLANAKTFTSLQEALKTPNEVYKLDLKKQKLKAFPQEILKFKNLTHLDLSKNKITELPENIGELENLQSLTLSKNKLTTLPKQIGDLANLTYLNINQNELTSIPAQMGKLENLETLDLWSNNIETFPEEIKYMKNLKRLDLRVILISDEEQMRLMILLPSTKIFFSNNCKCQL